MNNEEAAIVLAKAQVYRPGIVVDDFTVAAWQEAFDDTRFEDALLAVRNLGRVSSSFIDPAQIRNEVARQRADRNNHSGGDKCYTCGGTWEQCARRHAFEVRNGVPDPHDFESSLTADRNAVPMPAAVRHQLEHLLDGKNLRKGTVA
jgi:hypothetical protein